MADQPKEPRRPDGAGSEVLLVSGTGRGPRLLARRLSLAGYRVDLASSEDEALRVFYLRGGHDVCVLGPLSRPGAAAAVARRLRHLDAALTVLAHPDSLPAGPLPHGVEVLPRFHLFSRAGIGAVLRELVRRRGPRACGREPPPRPAEIRSCGRSSECHTRTRSRCGSDRS